MNILQEILKWSQGLPPWQSDAVARLLRGRTPSESDKDDLYALLKSAHGIADPKGRVATPLAAGQVPTTIAPSSEIALVAIKNLHNVNALAEKHRLQFGGTGMTVIYGENGSGKSGYSRVLKHACRARDRSETIYPNAGAPAAGPAEADFEISVDGTSTEVHWVDSTEPPAILSSIAIFDTLCARAYLDKEDDFSYVPYGLDVFDGLAALCVDLKRKLDSERTQNAIDLSVFASLAGDTAVGHLVAGLSAATKPETVDALATLSADESARHAALATSLKEADPREKARQFQLREQRIAALADTVSRRAAAVGDTVVSEIKQRAERLRVAREAARLAAAEFSQGEKLLPGTGGAAWRALFEAAREFARDAHPHEKFPELSPGSACPLCQQPLNEGATLLPRLQAYLDRSAEREVAAATREFEPRFSEFNSLNPSLGIDPVLLAELEPLDPELTAAVKAFEEAIASRRQSVIGAVGSGDWSAVTPEPANPGGRLQELARLVRRDREGLLQASEAETRASLQSEFNELDARVRMVGFKAAIDGVVLKLRHIARLDGCVKALNTRGISSKASELMQSAISAELGEALNREFRELGVSSLRVSLQSRSSKGKPLHKLVLQLPKAPSPRDVLSEGEQRSIALGSFLAEVNLGGAKGPVVFDDPVSSLDHRRRNAVARRLVSEAKNRQVIVFTHCLYFLYLLDEEAKAQEVPLLTQSLTQTSAGYGIAEADLPFEGKTTSKRIGTLMQMQSRIAAIAKAGDEAQRKKETVEAYKLLRDTWERAVEEVLFGEVVLRFRKGVETNRLSIVKVEDSDFEKVREGMSRCSNFTHDKAILGGIFVPEPDELLSDIQSLEDWRRAVDARNKVTQQTRKQRKSVGKVSAASGAAAAPGGAATPGAAAH